MTAYGNSNVSVGRPEEAAHAVRDKRTHKRQRSKNASCVRALGGNGGHCVVAERCPASQGPCIGCRTKPRCSGTVHCLQNEALLLRLRALPARRSPVSLGRSLAESEGFSVPTLVGTRPRSVLRTERGTLHEHSTSVSLSLSALVCRHYFGDKDATATALQPLFASHCLTPRPIFLNVHQDPRSIGFRRSHPPRIMHRQSRINLLRLPYIGTIK